MARKLEAEEHLDENGVSDEKSDDKLLLNRRKYVTLSGAAVATFLLGSSPAQSTDQNSTDENTYWADFSEGTL